MIENHITVNIFNLHNFTYGFYFTQKQHKIPKNKNKIRTSFSFIQKKKTKIRKLYDNDKLDFYFTLKIAQNSKKIHSLFHSEKL